MSENIERSNAKFILKMESSNIITTQYRKGFLLTNSILITVQTLLIIVSIVLAALINNPIIINCICGTVTIVNILLTVGVVINCYVYTHIWNKSLLRLNKLIEEVLQDVFNKDYTVDDDANTIRKVKKYREGYLK